MSMSDTITVKHAVFYAYHGATLPQIRQGQRFIIDASVTQDMEEACRNDNMDGLLDCTELYQIMKEVTTGRRYTLACRRNTSHWREKISVPVKAADTA